MYVGSLNTIYDLTIVDQIIYNKHGYVLLLIIFNYLKYPIHMY